MSLSMLIIRYDKSLVVASCNLAAKSNDFALLRASDSLRPSRWCQFSNSPIPTHASDGITSQGNTDTIPFMFRRSGNPCCHASCAVRDAVTTIANMMPHHVR